MELKRITSPEEISTMFEIKDDYLIKQLPCAPAEWIQWLQACCHIPLIGIWGFINAEGKVKKYIVATNGVMLPISRSIMLLYQNFFRHHEMGFDALEAIEAWALECGATQAEMESMYPKIAKVLGFEEKKSRVMVWDFTKKSVAQVREEFKNSRLAKYGIKNDDH